MQKGVEFSPLQAKDTDWLTPEGKLTANQAQGFGIFIYDLIIDHLAPDIAIKSSRELTPVRYDLPLRWSIEEGLRIQYVLDSEIISKWLNSASRQTAQAVIPFLNKSLEIERLDEESGIERGHLQYIQEDIHTAERVIALGIDAVLKDHRDVLDRARAAGFPTTLRYANINPETKK